MEKEIKIEVDLEDERRRLYDFIVEQLNDAYTFTFKSDYVWFNRNIVQQGSKIYDFNYEEFENDLYSKVVIFYATGENNIYVRKIELIRQKTNYEIPKYESGEQDND